MEGMVKLMRRPAILLAFLLATATAAQQRPRATFHAVISGLSAFCGGVPFVSQHLDWIAEDFTVYTEHGSHIYQVDSADGRALFAGIGGGRIVRLAPDGTQTPFFQHPSLAAGEFAVTRSGRVFAVLFDTSTSPPYRTSLAVIGPDGSLEALHSLPFPGPIGHATTIWDAGDDCTLLFRRTQTTVGRMNACTGQFLSDFTTVSSFVNDVEPLPDGRFLIASSGELALHDASGVRIRQIATPLAAIRQVAVSRDTQTVWYVDSDCGGGGGGLLFAVSFSDGQPLFDEPIGISINLPTGLVIADAGADVPALSATSLALLAATLALAAVSVLRR